MEATAEQQPGLKRQRTCPSEQDKAKKGGHTVKRKVRTGGDGNRERLRCLTDVPLGTMRWVDSADEDGYYLKSLHCGCDAALHEPPFDQDTIRAYVSEVEEVASTLELDRPISVDDEDIRAGMQELVEDDPFHAKLVSWTVPDPENPKKLVSLGQLCMHTLYVPLETKKDDKTEEVEESQQA
jgi:hypothetical protein